MANFSLKALLGLDTANFKKGISEAKRGVESLNKTFMGLSASIGAGLGMFSLIKNMKDVAVQVSTVEATLKNVSQTTAQYSANQAFLNRLAKEYKQDILTLTGGFAQFHAAADTCNVSLEEQRHIYESLTKAATFYHMSADQTNNMMLAVQQMMSKGKVTAEELRRQLGNSLPGAFGLMAEACGVTNAELEHLMKAGKLLSGEVLPKFANVLDEMISKEKIDLNSLQLSINEVKNAWYELVKSTDAQDLFKGVIDNTTSALKYIKLHINGIKTTIVEIVGLIGIAKITKWGAGLISTAKSYLKLLGETLIAEEAIAAANAKRANPLKGAAATKVGQKAVKGASAKEIMNAGWSSLGGAALKAGPWVAIAVVLEQIVKQTISNNRAQKELNELAEEEVKIKKELENPTSRTIEKMERLKAQIEDTNLSEEERKRLVKEINLECGLQGNQMLTNLSTQEDMVSAVLMELKYRKSLKQLEDAQSVRDAAEEYASVNEEQHKKDKAFLDEYNRELEIEAKRAEYHDPYAYTGTNLRKTFQYQKINDATVREAAWKKNTEDARQDAKIAVEQAVAGLEEGVQSNKKAWEKYSADKEELQGRLKQGLIDEATYESALIRLVTDSAQNALNRTGNTNPPTGSTKDTPYQKIQKNYASKARSLEAQYNGVQDSNGKTIQLIDEDTYNKERYKLLTDTVEKLAELGGEEIKTDWSKAIIDAYRTAYDKYESKSAKTGQLKSDYDADILDIVESIKSGKITLEDSIEEYDDLKSKYFSKLIEIFKDFTDETGNLDWDAVLKELPDDLKAFAQSLKDAMGDISKHREDKIWKNYKEPVRGEGRDHFFDYKDKQSKQYKKDAKEVEEYIDALEKAENYLKKYEGSSAAAAEKLKWVKEELKKVREESDNLADKAKISEWLEDLEKAEKQLTNAWLSGIKGTASSLQRLTRNLKSFKEIWEDEDSTEWEKLITTINELISVIETTASAVKAFQAIEDAIQTKEDTAHAKTVANKMEEMGLIQAGTAANIESMTTEAAASTLKAGAEKMEAKATEEAALASVAKATADGTEAGATLTAAGASAAKAVAEGSESVAKIPYVGAALAVAAAIALSAALASAFGKVKKFETGGIIGGNSTQGDKVPAMVNSGEMILNKAQQSNLFRAINDGNLGGNVNFEIRGDRLVGCIENYNKRKRG